MPMKLKLQDRTTATDDVFEAMKDLWKARWKVLNDEILQADPRMKDFVMKRNAMNMQKLRANVQDRTAFDHQRTQLLSLPYASFSMVEHAGSRYFLGITRPILMVDNASKKYDCPRYFVYIPVDYTVRGTSASYHFIPEGFEMVGARHPHHRGYSGGKKIEHPLDMSSSTCWGDFPTVVQGCVRTADTPGLFRVLHLYLSRVNMHSLLCSEFFSTGIAKAPTRK